MTQPLPPDLQPQPQAQTVPPPVDPGNSLLSETPAQMTAALVDTPAGQRLALTIRTASTTLTVLLDGRDARAWAAHLTRSADSMSVTGLVVAGAATMPNGSAP